MEVNHCLTIRFTFRFLIQLNSNKIVHFKFDTMIFIYFQQCGARRIIFIGPAPALKTLAPTMFNTNRFFSNGTNGNILYSNNFYGHLNAAGAGKKEPCTLCEFLFVLQFWHALTLARQNQ
jgi:hypothetical protein